MNLAGKKVLVTGAGGFIGSHLVEALVHYGCNVRAFVRYNALGLRGWLDQCAPEVQKQIEIWAGDIRDFSSVRKAMEAQQVVFHLAALISIPHSYRDPESFVQTNVVGTLNVLQAAKDSEVERVLITSTSEVYGTARYVPIDEQHPRQPQSPYSATKIAADSLAESFYRSYDLPVVIVRPFNTYGPRQSARAVIPTIITQLLSGMRTIRLGALFPTRDLVFVEDTVQGFIRLAETDEAVGRDVNIATGQEISIEKLAHLLIQMINPEAHIEVDSERLRPQKSEVARLCGDPGLLRQLTGWIPEHTLQEGLSKTIKWFKENQHLPFYRAEEYVV